MLVFLHRLAVFTARFWTLIVAAGSLGLQSSYHGIALLTLFDCIDSTAVLAIAPPFPPVFLKILRVAEYHLALLT